MIRRRIQWFTRSFLFLSPSESFILMLWICERFFFVFLGPSYSWELWCLALALEIQTDAFLGGGATKQAWDRVQGHAAMLLSWMSCCCICLYPPYVAIYGHLTSHLHNLLTWWQDTAAVVLKPLVIARDENEKCLIDARTSKDEYARHARLCKGEGSTWEKQLWKIMKRSSCSSYRWSSSALYFTMFVLGELRKHQSTQWGSASRRGRGFQIHSSKILQLI